MPEDTTSTRDTSSTRGRLNWTGFADREDQLLIVLSLVIGVVVGLTVVAFMLLTGRLSARMYPPGNAAWRRVLVPTAGALVSGYLLFRYFPGARGSGIPQTKFALFIEDGYISLKTVFGKLICCSISLASGIAEARAFFETEGCNSWVVGEGGRVAGMLHRSQIEAARPEAMLRDVIDTGSLFPHVHPDNSAGQALERMRAGQVDVLPVVSRADLRALRGMVTLRGLLAVYGVSEPS